MAILISKKVTDSQSWNLTWGLMGNLKVCAPFEQPGRIFSSLDFSKLGEKCNKPAE